MKGSQFPGGLTQTPIDRLVGWLLRVPWCGLTRTLIDRRVFPWTCRPPGNALRWGFASPMPVTREGPDLMVS
jgi:hypothetical protein